MIGWLNPVALAGLLAAAGPIAVHLLRRQRAGRLPFASLRFIRAASTAAVRLRRPSDVWLLMVRIAIVCGAAVALAQPVFVTPGRRASWDGRLSRAIVVDTSPSMAGFGERASEAASAEALGVAHAVRVDAGRIRDGLSRAVEALRNAPPSRREIVVISDFPVGSVTRTDLAAVPPEFGLRFVVAGTPAPSGEFRGDVALAAPGVAARVQHILATADGTAVRVAAAGGTADGLRLLNADEGGDPLLRAVARAGAPGPSPDQPLTIAFAGDAAVTLEHPENVGRHRWMLRTILAMRRDRSLADAAREHRRRGTLPGSPWVVVARDETDAPVVMAAARGTSLVLLVAAAPVDYLAAATLRSALIARRGEPDWGEREVDQIPAADRAAWTRDAAPIAATSWHDLPLRAPGDGRWVWAAVLALLALETLGRRRQRASRPEAYADAA